MKIDIKSDDLDISVDGQHVLYIRQVSDDEVINLFLYPKDVITKSLIREEFPNHKCTHELLAIRV